MRKFILSIILVTSAVCAAAQLTSPTQLKSEMAQPDSITGAKVIIHESAETREILNRTSQNPDAKVKGYRVRIFFNNSQNSRTEANNIASQFAAAFPDIPVYSRYDNPYFKVTVGDCLTSEEAIIIWGRIREQFRSAFIVREDIPIKNLMINEIRVTSSDTTEQQNILPLLP